MLNYAKTYNFDRNYPITEKYLLPVEEIICFELTLLKQKTISWNKISIWIKNKV